MAEMFIGGEFAASEGERTVVASPAGGEPVDTVPEATPADVDAAVAAAAGAFEAWWSTPASRRGELLHRGARRVLAHRGELAPGVHAVSADVDREVGRLKLAALGVRIDEPTVEQQDYRQSWA